MFCNKCGFEGNPNLEETGPHTKATRKKCATLLGIGLHVYKSSSQASSLGQNDNENNSNFQRGSNNSGNNGNGDNRISAKQHRYIMSLSLERGISKSKLNEHCLEAYAVAVDYLTRADASSLIENLLNE